MVKKEEKRLAAHKGIRDLRKLKKDYKRYNANPISCEWDNNGCLIALRNKRKNYHDINREGKKWLLHRWIFFINQGYLPQEVMHTCDNPHCINPLHLIAGNRKLNELDKKNKGRSLFGEKNPMAKLTLGQVSQIREESKNRKRKVCDICKENGICLASYYNIINGDTWGRC